MASPKAKTQEKKWMAQSLTTMPTEAATIWNKKRVASK